MVHFVHFDEHADLELPHLSSPVPGQAAPLAEAARFAYSELTIGSFVYPLLFQGGVSHFVWVRPPDDAPSPMSAPQTPQCPPKLLHLFSKDNARCVIGVTDDITRVGAMNYERKSISFASCYLPAIPSDFADGQLFIDIDLDYLSCGSLEGGSWAIEITKEAYEDYLSNPYGRARLLFGQPHRRLAATGGRYFFTVFHRDVHFARSRRNQPEEIIRRIRCLTSWMARHQNNIVGIAICKSAKSGYTPEDQVDFILESLTSALMEILAIDRIELGNVVQCGSYRPLPQFQPTGPASEAPPRLARGRMQDTPEAVSELVRRIDASSDLQCRLQAGTRHAFRQRALLLAQTMGYRLSAKQIELAIDAAGRLSDDFFGSGWSMGRSSGRSTEGRSNSTIEITCPTYQFDGPSARPFASQQLAIFGGKRSIVNAHEWKFFSGRHGHD